MKTKFILLIICCAALLFPLYGIFEIENLSASASGSEAGKAVTLNQISLWVTWIILASISVYYKWTEKRDFFFYFTYFYILTGFIIFGFYTDQTISRFEITTIYGKEYPLGIFSAIKNIITMGFFTGFLQLAVSFFKRKWHRH